MAVATAGAFALITLVNASGHFFPDFYRTLYITSGHLVDPTLILAGTFFAVTTIGLVATGRLGLRDLGWQREKVGRGLALTAGVWVGFQLVEVVAALAAGTGLRLSPDWTAAGWAAAVGSFLALVLALAPGEETFFRGFLLTQMRMRFTHMKASAAVATAIALSNLIFALYHLPNLVWGISGKVGTSPSDIAVQLGIDFLTGVLFAGMYLRTGNLFLVIGIHTLQDAGTSLVAAPVNSGLVILILASVLLLATLLPSVRRRLIR